MGENYKLVNGVKIPNIMIGTYNIFGDEAKSVFSHAYEIGYWGIDCGRYYKNEKDWGDALKSSGAKRKDVFIQTKVSHADEKKKGFDVIKDFETTLLNFQTDYIDCLLIHWPNISTLKSTWESMERLYHDGKVRIIGVSNFRPEHFNILKKTATVFPMVLQMERNPCRKQAEIYEYCQINGIQLQAYQPLAVGRPELMQNPLLMRIAKKHGCTVAQVALAWNIRTGVIPLPRSRNTSRLKENYDAAKIQLTVDEINEIDDDKSHYFRSLTEGAEYPGYWDQIHYVNVERYL